MVLNLQEEVTKARERMLEQRKEKDFHVYTVGCFRDLKKNQTKQNQKNPKLSSFPKTGQRVWSPRAAARTPLEPSVNAPRSSRHGTPFRNASPEPSRWGSPGGTRPAGRKSRPGPAGPRPPPSPAMSPRTCGEDLPQDHLRHLGGAQPGPPQHLTDHGGPQLVRRQRRQAAVEGAWADTEGERSGPAPGTGAGRGGNGDTHRAPAGTPAARPGPSPTAVLAAATKTTGSALMAAAGAERSGGGKGERERQRQPQPEQKPERSRQ